MLVSAVETVLFSNVIKDAVIVDEPPLLFRIFTQIFALEPGRTTVILILSVRQVGYLILFTLVVVDFSDVGITMRQILLIYLYSSGCTMIKRV
jgi:hypothetical protein